MAATGILPTQQRYINGVPVPQNRRTFRLKEKYILLLVFMTFGTVCFGAMFFLPDLRDHLSSIDGLQVQDVFVIQPMDESQNHKRHDSDDYDDHKINDQKKFQEKLDQDKLKDELLAKVREQLNMNEQEVKDKIADDKKDIVEGKKTKELEEQEKQKKDALDEVKDPGAVIGAQGGEPADEENKRRRNKIKDVSVDWGVWHVVLTLNVRDRVNSV